MLKVAKFIFWFVATPVLAIVPIFVLYWIATHPIVAAAILGSFLIALLVWAARIMSFGEGY